MSYLQALAEPNNSLVKSLTDSNFQNLRSGQQMDINSKVLADRREQAMGRAPVYFDPERAGENINYQISRGTPMLQQQAQQNAINQILQAAGVGKFATNADTRQQNNLNSLASVYALKTMGPSAYALKTMGPQATGPQTTTQSPVGRAQTGVTGLQQILQMFNQPGQMTYNG